MTLFFGMFYFILFEVVGWSICKTVNNLLGRANCSVPSSVESNGRVYTKPIDIANIFEGF